MCISDRFGVVPGVRADQREVLSLIHISEPTRLRRRSYAVFCLKKKIPMLCVTIFVILVVWFWLPRVARLMIHTPNAISIFVFLSIV